jgi:hypothetical protein
MLCFGGLAQALALGTLLGPLLLVQGALFLFGYLLGLYSEWNDAWEYRTSYRVHPYDVKVDLNSSVIRRVRVLADVSTWALALAVLVFDMIQYVQNRLELKHVIAFILMAFLATLLSLIMATKKYTSFTKAIVILFGFGLLALFVFVAWHVEAAGTAFCVLVMVCAIAWVMTKWGDAIRYASDEA